MTGSGSLLSSDAWLFQAAALAARLGSTTLAHVIGAGDALQHAIFTKEELDGGISRLRRAGYVEFGASGIVLTATGRDVADRAAVGAKTVSDELKAVEALLGTPAWTPGEDPRKARGGEPDLLTSDEYETAVRDYRKLLRVRA